MTLLENPLVGFRSRESVQKPTGRPFLRAGGPPGVLLARHIKCTRVTGGTMEVRLTG